jgi:hypothetical protein
MKKLSEWSDDKIAAALKKYPDDNLLASWCRTYRPDLWKRVLREVDCEGRKHYSGGKRSMNCAIPLTIFRRDHHLCQHTNPDTILYLQQSICGLDTTS